MITFPMSINQSINQSARHDENDTTAPAVMVRWLVIFRHIWEAPNSNLAQGLEPSDYCDTPISEVLHFIHSMGLI
jgi:hypothetical protein